MKARSLIVPHLVTEVSHHNTAFRVRDEVEIGEGN